MADKFEIKDSGERLAACLNGKIIAVAVSVRNGRWQMHIPGLDGVYVAADREEALDILIPNPYKASWQLVDTTPEGQR